MNNLSDILMVSGFTLLMVTTTFIRLQIKAGLRQHNEQPQAEQ